MDSFEWGMLVVFPIVMAIFMFLLFSGILPQYICEVYHGGVWVIQQYPSGALAGHYCDAPITEKRG